MLVLSRRQGQKIVFPSLGISVEMLRVTGNSVRVGVDAPSHVTVLRDEIARRDSAVAERISNPLADRETRHALRNKLNSAKLAAILAQKQLQADLTGPSAHTLERLVADVRWLEELLLPPAQTASAATTDNRPLRTLLVEDDPNECELLAGVLRMNGFQVDTAGDGADALNYLTNQSPPDIVLLDMLMPRMDGPATIKAIRHNPLLHGLRIFAVSGTEPASLGVPTGPDGVDGWFHKPLEPEILVREMGREVSRLRVR